MRSAVPSSYVRSSYAGPRVSTLGGSAAGTLSQEPKSKPEPQPKPKPKPKPEQQPKVPVTSYVWTRLDVISFTS